MPNARVAVFLDYNSIEAASRSKGIVADYGKLLEWLADRSNGRELVYAIAYVKAGVGQEEQTIADTETRLTHAGYNVKTVICSSERSSTLGIELTMDLVKCCFKYEPNLVVLLNDEATDVISPIVDYLRRETNTLVEIANFSGNQPANCINLVDLNLACDAITRSTSN